MVQQGYNLTVDHGILMNKSICMCPMLNPVDLI